MSDGSLCDWCSKSYHLHDIKTGTLIRSSLMFQMVDYYYLFFFIIASQRSHISFNRVKTSCEIRHRRSSFVAYSPIILTSHCCMQRHRQCIVLKTQESANTCLESKNFLNSARLCTFWVRVCEGCNSQGSLSSRVSLLLWLRLASRFSFFILTWTHKGTVLYSICVVFPEALSF